MQRSSQKLGQSKLKATNLINKGPESWLRFEVQDTGIGMSSDTLSILFHSFTQADASTARLYGGSGLGLAICKKLVKAMGGEIGVESRLGKGSLFWFELPLQRHEDRRKALRDKQELKPSKRSKSLRILVAEDNQINQLVAKEFLESLGHRVELVANGFEAIASSRKFTI